MEKRTLLAVVLSVLVIIVMFGINQLLYPPEPISDETPATEAEQTQRSNGTAESESGDSQSEADPDAEEAERDLAEGEVIAVPDDEAEGREVVYESDVMRVTMDTDGAVVRSIELLNHTDGDEPVNMVLSGDSPGDAFALRFGGRDGRIVDESFRLDREEDNVFVFSRRFAFEGNEDEPFELRKRFRFEPGEYLIEVDVELVNSVNENVPLDFNGNAYTLTYGPQIGPRFTMDELGGRFEYRRFETLTQNDGLNHETYENLQPGDSEIISDRVIWAGLSGKYFAALGVTDSTRYEIGFERGSAEGLPMAQNVHFSRPEIRSSSNTDTFRFYTGPKNNEVLTRYNRASDNAFGVSGLNFDESQDIRPILGWLENILEMGLNFFYGIIPNYGVAIILLTLVVKGALYPLTRKSFTSMRRMQELQPQINEIREKYKNDQQKMNQAMADFYKKEKVNPLGGCLPLLLQIPFFIAMFGVFNNSFDLRGATFIAGWIDDLSATESILSWAGPSLPVIGTDLRALPFIFLASQLFTSKFMQSGAAGSSTQQKVMKYALPAFIFFVLYNMPSGLLLYIILTNVITGLQQFLAGKSHAAATS